MDKKIKKDKNSFLIVWISCIVLLLTMCYFGVNSSSIKGTSAVDTTCSCPYGTNNYTNASGKKFCSGEFDETEKQQLDSSWTCSNNDFGLYVCTSYEACGNTTDGCAKDGWVIKESAGESTKTACCPSDYVYYSTVTKLHDETGTITNSNGTCVKNPVDSISKTVTEWSYFANSSWGEQDWCMITSTNGQGNGCPSGHADSYKTSDSLYQCLDNQMSLCSVAAELPITVSVTEKKQCWMLNSGEYYWGIESLDNSNVKITEYTTESDCEGQNKCYLRDGKYIWGVFELDANAQLQSSYTDKDSCLKNNKQCYKCSSSSDIYGWASSDSELAKDRAFCASGGWTPTNDNKESCFKKKAGVFNAYFKSNDGGTVDKNSLSCEISVEELFSDDGKEYNDKKVCSITMPGATRSGYTFNGWTKVSGSCDNPIKEDSSEKLTSSGVNYHACWTKNSSGGGNGGGTGDTPSTPSDKTITGTFMNDSTQFATTTCTTSGGNSCTLPAPTTNPTKDGYTFKGWGSSGCTNGWTGNKSGVSSNQTYYACWLNNTPAETSKPGSGGNVSTNPGTGPIAIAITWFVGIFAIAYSVFYFKKIKEN